MDFGLSKVRIGREGFGGGRYGLFTENSSKQLSVYVKMGKAKILKKGQKLI